MDDEISRDTFRILAAIDSNGFSIGYLIIILLFCGRCSYLDEVDKQDIIDACKKPAKIKVIDLTERNIK